ncbi:hypothetical protein R1sor_021686 [Riccia sorocarpa]|uniref:Uncharacterized protein n=1 Tax=Riccia sorocarpa TaxID=122646 RepID=A0ABD3GL21_9MARC
MLNGWTVGKQMLRMAEEEKRMPPATSMEVILRAGVVKMNQNKKEWDVIKRRTKTMRVIRLQDLQGRTWERLKAFDLLCSLPDTKVSVTRPHSEQMACLITWVGNTDEQVVELTSSERWRWGEETHSPTDTWQRSLEEWRKHLLPEYKLRENMNSSWGLNWDTKKWADIWNGLRRSCLAPRDKTWLWRLLNKGFFTLERAATMEVEEPICKRCNNGTENIEHIYPGSHTHSVHVEIQVYEGRGSPTPTKVIILEAERTAASLARRYTSKARTYNIEKGKREIAQMHCILITDKLKSRNSIYFTRHPQSPVARQEHLVPTSHHENRAIDREDALEGHHPKERSAQEENPTIESTDHNSEHDIEGAQPVRMQRELQMLGFTEFIMTEAE